MIKVSDYRRIEIPRAEPDFNNFIYKLQDLCGKYTTIYLIGGKIISGLVLWIKEDLVAVKTKKNIYYIIADKIISIAFSEV